ncbi:MAG: tight adherence protein [Actinomycetota bacterium]|nr:tight adherence protein [Actinomycetota bacterium]
MNAWLPLVLAAAAAGLLATPGRDGALRLRAVTAAQAGGSSSLVLALAVGGATAAVVVGLPAALLVVAGGLLVAASRRAQRDRAAADRERSQALDALSMLGAELRAGRTPAEAFAVAAGMASGGSAAALTAAAAAARLGGDVASALTASESAVASTLAALAACWEVCSDAGNGLAAAVERLEAGMRAAEAQRRSVAAELAGPRATAQLLAVLPLVGVGLAAGLGAHPVAMLLGTPLGWGCLTAGLALDGLGVVWTRRLTGRAMP